MDREYTKQKNLKSLTPPSRLGLKTGDLRNKFDNRIRLLFLASFVTIGLYALTATAVFISLARSQTEFIDTHVNKLLIIKDLEISVEAASSDARAYVLTKAPLALEQAQIHHENAKSLIEDLKHLAEDPSELEVINTAEKSLNEYIDTVMEVTGGFTSHFLGDQPTESFKENMLPEKDFVSAEINKIKQYTNTQFQNAGKQAQKIWRLSYALYAVVALFSLVFFGGLRWVLIRALNQKRQAEEALYLSEEIARQAIDISGIGVFIHNHLNNTIHCSPKLFNIMGFQEGMEFTIAKYFEAIHESDRQMVIESIDKSLKPASDNASANTFSVEHRIVRSDGEIRWVIVRGQTFFKKIGGQLTLTQSIGAVLDITQRKETELSLRQAMDDLAQEKLKLERSNHELDQFASIAAHDLRSPITSMLGWVGIIDKLIPKPRDEKISKAIRFITDNARKADALITDLLAVARLNTENVKLETIDLNKLIKDVTKVLKDPIDTTNTKISSQTLPKLTGCLSHFESLFTNLIRNAITYRHNERAPLIEIACHKNTSHYEFSVKDNGIGIEPQYADRVFEMFKRLNTDNEHNGTGIGLAYCKKIVELHGGKIWVNSTPQLGSTFHFTYPINEIRP